MKPKKTDAHVTKFVVSKLAKHDSFECSIVEMADALGVTNAEVKSGLQLNRWLGLIEFTSQNKRLTIRCVDRPALAALAVQIQQTVVTADRLKVDLNS